MDLNGFVFSLFLYFPEDKTEYIPAAIWMVFAFIAAIVVMSLFVKISKKEAQKAKEIEKYQQTETNEQKES